jgi:hypothetical protein
MFTPESKNVKILFMNNKMYALGLTYKEYNRQAAEKWRRKVGMPTREQVNNKNFENFIEVATKVHNNKYAKDKNIELLRIKHKLDNPKPYIENILISKLFTQPL